MAHTNDNCGAWVIELLEVGPESQGEIGWEIGRGDMKPSLDLGRVTREIRAQRTSGTTITPSLR